MNIFINEIRIVLCSLEQETPRQTYDYAIDILRESLKYNYLSGKVLIQNPSLMLIRELLHLIIEDKFDNLTHLTLQVNDLKEVKKNVKKKFKIIKAGGGLVQKEDKLLMIYRLMKWDLPKGKMDMGEKFKEAAQREVEEECNIKIEMGDKICTTWHFYEKYDKTKVLKQTRWYSMNCLEDTEMKPQIEEDIEDVRWMSSTEVLDTFTNTYETIKFVFESYDILFRT